MKSELCKNNMLILRPDTEEESIFLKNIVDEHQFVSNLCSESRVLAWPALIIRFGIDIKDGQEPKFIFAVNEKVGTIYKAEGIVESSCLYGIITDRFVDEHGIIKYRVCVDWLGIVLLGESELKKIS